MNIRLRRVDQPYALLYVKAKFDVIVRTRCRFYFCFSRVCPPEGVSLAGAGRRPASEFPSRLRHLWVSNRVNHRRRY